MPIDLQLDKTNDVIYRTVTGRVSADELLENLECTRNHPDYHPGMASLSDMRDYVHQATNADIRRIAQFFTEHLEDIRGSRAAIVVSKTASYGMSRMLQSYLEGAPLSVLVTYDLAEAKQWLGIA
jgi:hypothetical protein